MRITLPAMYATHQRPRQYPACDTCRKPFVSRAPNARRCGICRALTAKGREELRRQARRSDRG